MDDKERKTASSRTVQVLLVAVIAFQLGGYATRFSWSAWGWIAVALGGAALAGALFLLIRGFWKPDRPN
jgi:hypothetical protein